MWLSLQSLLGVISILLIAWLLSENRKALDKPLLVRTIAAGLGLQFFMAGVFLLIPQTTIFFQLIGDGVAAIQAATNHGVRLVFGYLGGGDAPFEIADPSKSFIFAFQALPLILVISVLSRIAYHWGVLQRIVAGFAWIFQRTLNIGGPLSTASAANIFVGMVEAPLLVRPYLGKMSRGDLFATMTVGMATVAGTVLALYAIIITPVVADAAGHLVAASVINAPAALMIARLMVPSGFGSPETVTVLNIPDAPKSTMDAVAQGTLDGLKLLAYVTAMLVVMVSLVALVNTVLSLPGPFLGVTLTVQQLLGWLMTPVAWLIGIPWQEAAIAGQLIGIKTVLNEFLAYLELGKMTDGELSQRSRLIMTYALCGFANLGSLGIMTGGLIAMVPERRDDIVGLGAKTILSGTLATLLTGAVVGVLVAN